MIIYQAYKYAYYRIYIWNRSLWGREDVPEYNAMFGMIICTFFNLLSIPILVEVFTGVRLFDFPKVSRGVFVLFIVPYMVLHYFLLVHNGRYKDIEKEFRKEPEESKRRKGYLVLMYALGSIVIFFGSFYGIYLRNG